MHRQRALTHFTGGIAMQVMSNRGSGAAVEVAAPAPPPTREQILVPLDLVACTTQRNVLLIMDSNNAQVFSQLRSMGIGKPPLLLLSPALERYPNVDPAVSPPFPLKNAEPTPLPRSVPTPLSSGA